MYIPTWLIIIVVITGIYFYLQFRKRNSAIENQDLTTEDMWRRAETNMAMVLEKSPLIEDYLQDERDMIKAMERDMIRLRERYKHNTQKQTEVARDWMDYSNAIVEIKFAREMLDVDMEDSSWESFDERTKDVFIVIQEIAKRVEKVLGQESSSKLVHDILRKKADAVDEIGKEQQKELSK